MWVACGWWGCCIEHVGMSKLITLPSTHPYTHSRIPRQIYEFTQLVRSLFDCTSSIVCLYLWLYCWHCLFVFVTVFMALFVCISGVICIYLCSYLFLGLRSTKLPSRERCSLCTSRLTRWVLLAPPSDHELHHHLSYRQSALSINIIWQCVCYKHVSIIDVCLL